MLEIEFACKIAGVLLLGAGLILGGLRDSRQAEKRNQQFLEHQARMDEMIGRSKR